MVNEVGGCRWLTQKELRGQADEVPTSRFSAIVSSVLRTRQVLDLNMDIGYYEYLRCLVDV